jgi:xanthine dehydrogenase YagR molybdenum-binding subunit
VVVAESFEAAREAANKVTVRYAWKTPSASFDSPGISTQPAEPMFGASPQTGDAEGAFGVASVTVDAEYETPTQHHNALELFTATCAWNGRQLTVYEPTQFMWGSKNSIAAQLGLDPDDVRVVSRFVGGAFGSKAANPRTVWIALAARRLGRPVKLVVTRDQGFTTATYRAETRHRVRLGATENGTLTAYLHDGWEITSRASGYNVAGVDATARMYACPNIATSVQVVHADRNTPGFMRAPAETPYMFALECAIDELAHTLQMDPIELRRINDAQTDPVTGLSFSSRSLMACYDQGAARFGWGERRPEPGSMRDGEWLVGYGCATACYPSNIGPAAARLTIAPDGTATIGLAGHEIGTGAYTTVAIAVAQTLGIDVDDVTVKMGDSDLPPVMIAGGSNNAASTVHVAVQAGSEARRRIAEAAVAAADGPFHGADPAALTLMDGKLIGPGNKTEKLTDALVRIGGRLEIYSEFVPEGLPRESSSQLYEGKMAMMSGSGRKDATAFAFGAHFVEVRIHRLTREIRVPRIVSAFAAGTIVNPMAAHSQLQGGAIWGVSSALFEASELDTGAARYINDNFADYLIPVNADIPSVEILMVAERDDTVNPHGIKGVGELGIVGMNAAVANAVFHATGTRLRRLPIRAENLL